MEWGIIVAAVSLFGTFALAVADVSSEPDRDRTVRYMPKRPARKLRKAA